MAINRVFALSKILTPAGCRSKIIPISSIQQLQNYRLLTLARSKQTKAMKTEKEKFRIYVVSRYIEYVKNYTKVLETRFPTAMSMYRVFSVGIKDFLRDLRTYISLRLKIARDKNFNKITREEIELYHKMPSDMWKIAPVLIFSAIPFGNYIIFPLAFLKPRKLLCSHFWSIQQRAEFSVQDLEERLKNNKPVLRALQAKLDSIPAGKVRDEWENIIGLLGSGSHPSPNEILACRELFSSAPYHLDKITYGHAGHLLKMHGLKKNLFRRKKLKLRAFLLMEMDKAIIREGGAELMSTECLRNACLLRGMNSTHLSNKEMILWLQQWLFISQVVDKDTYSLILHCPILIGYNLPQNWKLIY